MRTITQRWIVSDAVANQYGSATDAKWFATTHWSVVLAARELDTAESARALEMLCRNYWYPAYVFTRRSGLGVEDARDATQGFFADMLGRKALGRADPAVGRFRSFLLTCLKHYLADERDKSMAVKRGAGRPVVSLDDADAETRYRQEPIDTQSPDKLFERRWAMTVLDQALNRLREEYAADDKAAQFERLHGFIFGRDSGLRYDEIAAGMGATETTVRTWMFRLRRRYGEILRGIVANTVTTPAEVDAELRHLIAVVSGH